MDPLVSTGMAGTHLAELGLSSSIRAGAYAGCGPQWSGRISRSARPRCSFPRHRRGQRPLQPRAAHAAERGTIRRRHGADEMAATIGSSPRRHSPARTAARGWFMLHHFGAEQVAILDGGLPKWVAEGRPTEMAIRRPAKPASNPKSVARKLSPSIRFRQRSPAHRCTRCGAL